MGSPEERSLSELGEVNTAIEFIFIAKADEGKGQGPIFIVQSFSTGGGKGESIDLIPEAEFPKFWEQHIKRLHLFTQNDSIIKR